MESVSMLVMPMRAIRRRRSRAQRSPSDPRGVVPPASRRPLGGRRPRAHTARLRTRSRGVTLIELSITIAFLAIAFGAVVSTLTASIYLNKSNSESHEAYLAGCSAIERLRSARFDEAFAAFNADPTDDPGGVGKALGNAFDVSGLSPQSGDADGRVGEIVFPGDGFDLREDAVNAELGLPCDLNGDGLVDNKDHSGNYKLLPVVVRVRWRGEAGDRVLEFTTLLTEMP